MCVCVCVYFIPDSQTHTVKPPYRVKARSRRYRPDQVDYWEGVLHVLYNKIFLKMIDHGPRSTWGPGPSGSGLQAQKYEPSH